MADLSTKTAVFSDFCSRPATRDNFSSRMGLERTTGPSDDKIKATQTSCIHFGYSANNAGLPSK